MTGRHSRAQPMSTDDPVAPGVRRSKAAWFTAAGILGIVLAIAGIALVLNEKAVTAQKDANLSSEEVRQLRDFLEGRGKQRDDERAETQAQLDQQRAVICSAIRTLQESARPQPAKVLAKAATDLRCAALPTVGKTPSGSTRRADTPAAPATRDPDDTPPAAPPTVGKATGRAPATRPAKPTATAAPTTAPAITRTPDPILGPVCVLGVCL